MDVFSFLMDLFNDEEARTEMAENPAGYVDEHLPEGLTSAEFTEGVAAVCGELPPEQAAVLRSVYGLDGPTTPTTQYPPPPPQEPGESDHEYVLRQINHYTDVVNVTNQTYEDNDTTTIYDEDTVIDNSVNQSITAFGDVSQSFDNDVVTGDDAVAAGDNAQVNTGDGAVQVGGDMYDSTVATGDVEGSVTGDVYDSVVGDHNQVVDTGGGNDGPPVLERLVVEDPYDRGGDVGAVAFGDGDAINAENVNQGDGAVVSDVRGDVAVNTGEGDQTVINDSLVNESAIGGGNVESNDALIIANDDSAVAFGEGSSAESTDIDITNDDGTVQVAGDDSIQQAVTDNSTNVDLDVDLGRGPVILAEAEAPEAYEPEPEPAPEIDDADQITQTAIDGDDDIPDF